MASWKDTGVARRGRRAWSAFGELLALRYELFRLEAREERARLVRAIVEAMVATLAAFASFVFLNVLVLVISGDGLRRQILVGLVVFYGLLALWVGMSLRRRLKNEPAPFSATVEELKKDGTMFRTDA